MQNQTKTTWTKQKQIGMLKREKGKLKQQTRHSSHAHSWLSRELGQITNGHTVWGGQKRAGRTENGIRRSRASVCCLGFTFWPSFAGVSLPPF